MNGRRLGRVLLPLLVSLAAAIQAEEEAAGSADTIASTDIIKHGYSFACMRYQAVGVCFWLKCGYGCSVKTSVKVEHYNPDAVVSAYHETGDNPWTDVQALTGELTGDQEGGNGTGGGAASQRGDDSSLRFKNVDVFGSPALVGFSAWASKSGYVCKSAVTSYEPYFISSLDSLGWRWSIPDMFNLASYIPYQRDIRDGGAFWGSVYPRSGFVLQPHDYKAAAVAAQRAGDIVTREDQGHIYDDMLADKEDGWWPPEELTEGDDSTGDWQRLLPEAETGCAVFPPSDDTQEVDVEDPNPGSDKGDYVFHLWRPYQCCKKNGQVFLFSVGGKQ